MKMQNKHMPPKRRMTRHAPTASKPARLRRSRRMRTPKTPEEMDRMSADLLGDEPL